MLQDILKLFFGSIISIFGVICLAGGLLGLVFNPLTGGILIVLGILLLCVGKVLGRHT